MYKAFVNKIIPFSSVDGPGNRTAIFLQGCNFNCLYCHNPETINHCVNCAKCVDECKYGALKIEAGKVIWDREKCKDCDMCIKICQYNSSPKVLYLSAEEVYEEVKKYKSFISGITVSGGECTLQIDFLVELFKKIKDLNLTTFVDTNGSIPLYDKSQLISLTDGFMVDLKSFSKEEHIRLTGKKNDIVLKNIEYLGKIHKLYEVRTVIVDELLDNYYNVDMISKLISEINPNIIYKLIRYRDHGVRKEIIQGHSPDDKTMEELRSIAYNNGCKIVKIV